MRRSNKGGAGTRLGVMAVPLAPGDGGPPDSGNENSSQQACAGAAQAHVTFSYNSGLDFRRHRAHIDSIGRFVLSQSVSVARAGLTHRSYMEGYVVRPARATARQRRNAWESAKRWGVKLEHFYADKAKAEQDARVATELSGIRFEVREAEAI